MRDQLPIIKLEVKLSELAQAIAEFKRSRKEALEALTDEIKSAVGEGFNKLLNTEIELFLGSSD